MVGENESKKYSSLRGIKRSLKIQPIEDNWSRRIGPSKTLLEGKMGYKLVRIYIQLLLGRVTWALLTDIAILTLQTNQHWGVLFLRSQAAK